MTGLVNGHRVLPLLFLICVAQCGITQAGPRPAVIELFTSQGCSSCPPADALLGELAQRPDVIALAFHVDYWDGLGWRDRFALPEASQRQQRYVRALGVASAFTPQALIDGRKSVVGSDRNAIGAALRDIREGIPIRAATFGGELRIDLDAWPVRESMDVILIAYLARAATSVPRGENAGRTLTEFNVVRAYRRLATWSGQSHQLSVPLSSLPPDASRVAILLQRVGQREIAGAMALSLP